MKNNLSVKILFDCVYICFVMEIKSERSCCKVGPTKTSWGNYFIQDAVIIYSRWQGAEVVNNGRAPPRVHRLHKALIRHRTSYSTSFPPSYQLLSPSRNIWREYYRLQVGAKQVDSNRSLVRGKLYTHLFLSNEQNNTFNL